MEVVSRFILTVTAAAGGAFWATMIGVGQPATALVALVASVLSWVLSASAVLGRRFVADPAAPSRSSQRAMVAHHPTVRAIVAHHPTVHGVVPFDPRRRSAS